MKSSVSFVEERHSDYAVTTCALGNFATKALFAADQRMHIDHWRGWAAAHLSRDCSWLKAYRREMTAWTGLPKETSDQIDGTSHACYITTKQSQPLGRGHQNPCCGLPGLCADMWLRFF